MNAMEPDMTGMSDREKLQTLIQAHKILRGEGRGSLGAVLLGAKGIHIDELSEAIKDVIRRILDRILASESWPPT